jgi:hypothetical protein
MPDSTQPTPAPHPKPTPHPRPHMTHEQGQAAYNKFKTDHPTLPADAFAMVRAMYGWLSHSTITA